jgi:hypothetical protein
MTSIEWLEEKLSIKVLLSATLIVLLMYLPPIFFEYTKAKNKTKVINTHNEGDQIKKVYSLKKITSIIKY